MSNITAKVEALSHVPKRQDGAFDRWILQEDVPQFLLDDANSSEFILYASGQHVLLQTVVAPVSSIDNSDRKELREWDLMQDKWGLNYDRSSVWLTSPFEDSTCKAYREAEPLVFHRFFEGSEKEKSYIEISQKLLLVFDLHYVTHKKAWCRLDEAGDIDPVIQHYIIPKAMNGHGGSIITIRRKVLDTYLIAGRFTALRAFDFTRFDPANFSGWGDGREQTEIDDETLIYRLTIQPGIGSYMRGIQIVRPGESMAQLLNRLQHGEGPKQYASFIAQDWKNGVVEEISCAPGATANYFTKSDLPFEVTPAFFKPEVLQKYKADSNKYRLEHRSIYCRGAWSLKTYDINEAGQLHTYLVYLRDLPYSEQLYWKSFNEPPKAPISKRAFTTDFEGNYHLEYDSLQSVIRFARRLQEAGVKWWSLKEEKILDKLHYPATDSSEEWAEEILTLDQLIVEGLETKWLKQTVLSFGQKPEASEKSLAFVERCLRGVGFDEEEAKQTLLPLRELHHLRSKVKGHVKGNDAEQLREDALNRFGSYRKHFDDLTTRCDASLRRIAQGFRTLGGEVPEEPA